MFSNMEAGTDDDDDDDGDDYDYYDWYDDDDGDDDDEVHVLLRAVDNDQIAIILQTAIPGGAPPCLVLVVVVLPE